MGTNSFSADAKDNAGNTGSGSTSFQVVVTSDGVCALVRQFVSNPGVANALCSQLSAAAASEARGNERAKSGQLAAFRNLVRAQSGKHVPADKAVILLGLADHLWRRAKRGGGS
ncbi:MAG: hypothetical protein WD801_15495 [Gemmatimonadaceae bacterium]